VTMADSIPTSMCDDPDTEPWFIFFLNAQENPASFY
jgi:hypothetical protein